MVRDIGAATRACQKAIAEAMGLDLAVVVWVEVVVDSERPGWPPHYVEVREALGTRVVDVTRERALELLRLADRAQRDVVEAARRAVASLSRDDVGRTVTIEHEGTTITGPLRGVEVWTDRVPVQELGEREPEHVDGRVSVTLTIGAWRTGEIPPDAKVDVR